MKRLWITLALVCALVGLAACSRRSQAEQLESLDSAYKAGVLSKEEYDAKKAALVGSATAPAAPTVSTAPTPGATPAAPAQHAPTAKTGGPEEPAPLAGCEDAEYKSHKNGKQSRFFPVPLDRARKGAFSALATLGFTIHKDSGGEVEASKKAGAAREVLHFEATKQAGKKGTRVTAETKKAGGAVEKSWSSAVLAQTACNLK